MLITTDWLDPADDDIMNTNAETLLKWAEDESQRRGLFSPFIYMNYASGSQSVIARSTSEEKLKKMREVKKKYDPDGILAELWHGGFKIQAEVGKRALEHNRSEL